MAKKSKEAPPPAADGATGAEGAPAGKKKPPMMMLVAAGVGALVVLGGGGAGAFMLLGKKPAAEASEHGEAKGEHGKPDKKKAKGGHGGGGEGGKDDPAAGVVREGPDGVVFYTMPDMVVNIQAADNRPTFLKLKLTFELADEEAVEAVQPATPRLKDMFTTFLRELRPEDLSGSQGSYQLRMEILRRANLVLAPAKVNAVLIEEMLVQ